MAEQEFFAGTSPTIRINACHGDLRIEGHSAESIRFRSDEELNVQATDDSITIEYVADDLRLAVPHGATIKLQTVHGDVAVRHVASLNVDTVEGDATFSELSSVKGNNIAGDVRVHNVQMLKIDNCGGDLKLEHAEECQVKNVGGDVRLMDVIDVAAEHVGGDVAAQDLRGPVMIKHVGGDVALRGAITRLPAMHIGGDLMLDTTWAADNDYRATVGGDVTLVLAKDTNLIISGTVGGNVAGLGSQRQGIVSATLGDGANAARVELTIGGDLRVRGLDSAYTGSSGSRSEWAGEWEGEIGNWKAMMQDIVDEFKTMGRDIADQFANHDWGDFSERQKERMRNEAERTAKRAQDAAERIRLRFNDREIHIDPERIERIKEQAQKAAEEGIARAQEAIERAFASFGTRPPAPPKPAAPPSPPTAPHRLKVSDNDGSATSDRVAPATGQTVRMDQVEANPEATSAPQPVSAQDLTQERLAILRMVESGKITSEEAALLLEALG